MALPGFREVTVELEEVPKLFQRIVANGIDARFAALGFTRKSNGFVNYGRPSLLANIPALAAAAGESIGISATCSSPA